MNKHRIYHARDRPLVFFAEFPCFQINNNSILHSERIDLYMKKIKKLLSVVLCLMLALACIPAAFAAQTDDAVIDPNADCSLTILKYDWTNAIKDGVWRSDSYVSTGQYDSAVTDTLGGTGENHLGNGETANGYAVKGVEYTYLQVAELVQYSVSGSVEVLYKFDKAASAGLLEAIGLEGGRNSHTDGNALDASCWYYQSDVLNAALAASLQSNATTLKNALENFVAGSGTRMPLTDENGFTKAENLPVGLYLIVETRVPEMVTGTTNPFFVSLPMTNVNGGGLGTEITDGGHRWLYDVTVYPKNQTGIVTLEKTVREANKDTGKNNATDEITDGFAHNATASAGDTLEYQIISTLPTITSSATAISVYTFQDILAKGLTYDSETPVKLEWFQDAACTDKVAAWLPEDGKFTVSTDENADGSHTMTIAMTDAGLAEINTANTDAGNENGSLYAGYSNYTLRVTYAAIVNSDESLVYGDAGNCNEVVLTWSRTSAGYMDTLIDDAHVYSYGIDLTKEFSDGRDDQSLFDHVKFVVRNKTDDYYVVAELNEVEGVYYVTGYTADEAEATAFHPVDRNGEKGQILIQGLEDDEYILTEVETADGYLLLKNSISVIITVSDDESRPCDVYDGDILGVLQNDPRYSFDGGYDLRLANIPQAGLAHNYLTASAAVDSHEVTMLADGGSANARVSLTVVNSRGFDLPQTGESGIWVYGAVGIALMSGALLVLLIAFRKKEEREARQ